MSSDNLSAQASAFKRMLTRLSRELTKPDLESMKFWCGQGEHKIGRGILEDIDEPEKLWNILQQRGRLSVSDTRFLKQLLLEAANRADLVNVVDSYDASFQCVDGRDISMISSPGIDAPPSFVPPTVQFPVRNSGDRHAEELRPELELISEQYGTGWRSFGRKLDLSEAELDGVVTKYPTDLKEQILQAMKIWCSKKRDQATRVGLVSALRQCQRNKLAGKVERLPPGRRT